MPLPPAPALSLFYIATFAALGVYLPYLNLYFEGIGLTGLQIGIVSTLVPLCGALVPAAAGLLADRLGRRRGLVLLSTALALLTFSLLSGARRFGLIVPIVTLYALVRAPALPLVEASAMEISEAGGTHYGRMRAWGSVAFIVAALGAGRLVVLWGEGSIPPLIMTLLGGNVLAAMLLPRDRPRPRPAADGPPLLGLLKRPGVALFLAAGVLSQAAHGPYYVFYSIHLEKAGYGPQAIGLLWALAVTCEVVAMWRIGPLVTRAGPLPTMAACLLLSSVRWWICSVSVSAPAMAGAQALHAASYAAFHIAAVTHAHRAFGAERRASGQALYASATYGLGNVIGMFLSGLFYDRIPTADLFNAAAWTALLGAFLVAGAARREIRTSRGV